MDACHGIDIDIESLSVSWPCIDKQGEEVVPSTGGACMTVVMLCINRHHSRNIRIKTTTVSSITGIQ